MKKENDRDYLRYTGATPKLFIGIVLTAMVIFFILYTSNHFFPELSSWLKGKHPDSTQWARLPLTKVP